MDKSVITRVVAVAGGRFAPGHLGELTQQVPFEMVDAVLEETCRVQRRVRDLPARVVVYLRALFFLLRGPSAAASRWRDLLVCAIDGTIMTVADSLANLAVYSKQKGGATGGSSYPQLRLLALVSCGTRTVIDAVFGSCSSGETTYATDLTRSLHAGMLLLADRNFGSGPLARKIAAAEADFLIRVKTGNSAPKLPVLQRLPDGSWLSRFGGVPVRVIDASWTVTTSTGRFTSDCRLVTTLTDATQFPAPDLAVLYHERWEIETTYLELKSTILGGRVLRARTPDRIEQEVWALLVTYQALRTAIADAASTVPGTDPDRASFTIALNTARDQVILAAGVIAGTSIDLAGRIGRLVLASLMPARRLRISPRVVKRAISKYNARGKVDRATCKATIDIAILSADSASGDEP